MRQMQARARQFRFSNQERWLSEDGLPPQTFAWWISPVAMRLPPSSFRKPISNLGSGPIAIDRWSPQWHGEVLNCSWVVLALLSFAKHFAQKIFVAATV